MKVKEMIQEFLSISEANFRANIEKLKEINAPSIVIEARLKAANECKNCKIRVQGNTIQ